MSDTQPGDSNPASNPGAHGVNVSGREAAQGRSGTQILMVLAVSIVLVVIVFAVIFGSHARKHADKTPGGSATVAGNTTAGSTFNAPPADSPKSTPPPEAVSASRGS